MVEDELDPEFAALFEPVARPGLLAGLRSSLRARIAR